MGEELVVSFILKLLWGFFFFKFIVADRIFFFLKARAFSFDEANRFSCVSYFPLSCIFLSLFSKIFFIGISRWVCVHRCGREKVTLLKVGTDFAVWGGLTKEEHILFLLLFPRMFPYPTNAQQNLGLCVCSCLHYPPPPLGDLLRAGFRDWSARFWIIKSVGSWNTHIQPKSHIFVVVVVVIFFPFFFTGANHRDTQCIDFCSFLWKMSSYRFGFALWR